MPDASPNAAGASAPDRAALPTIFATLWVLIMFFLSLLPAVVAGQQDVAADLFGGFLRRSYASNTVLVTG